MPIKVELVRMPPMTIRKTASLNLRYVNAKDVKGKTTQLICFVLLAVHFYFLVLLRSFGTFTTDVTQ